MQIIAKFRYNEFEDEVLNAINNKQKVYIY